MNGPSSALVPCKYKMEQCLFKVRSKINWNTRLWRVITRGERGGRQEESKRFRVLSMTVQRAKISNGQTNHVWLKQIKGIKSAMNVSVYYTICIIENVNYKKTRKK